MPGAVIEVAFGPRLNCCRVIDDAESNVVPDTVSMTMSPGVKVKARACPETRASVAIAICILVFDLSTEATPALTSS